MTLPWMPYSAIASRIIAAFPGVATPTDSGGWNGYTARLALKPAALVLPNRPTRIRVRFNAAVTSKPLQISNAYIGERASSGDDYDYQATPTQLLFSGSASVLVALNTSVWSDWAPFAWDTSRGLVTAFYITGGSTDSLRSYRNAASNDVNSYFKLGNDSTTVNASSYSLATLGQGVSYAIDRIEVDSF